FSGLTALTAEFTVGEGELMTHDEPFFMAPDDKHDLISGTCSHLPKQRLSLQHQLFKRTAICLSFLVQQFLQTGCEAGAARSTDSQSDQLQYEEWICSREWIL
ncbi:hypothetical protein ACK31G_17945, partial [Aeromonas caviae]